MLDSFVGAFIFFKKSGEWQVFFAPRLFKKKNIGDGELAYHFAPRLLQKKLRHRP